MKPIEKKRTKLIEEKCIEDGFFAGKFSNHDQVSASFLHSHDQCLQLLFPLEGSMRVKTLYGNWYLPFGYGVWISEKVEHDIILAEKSVVTTIYLLSEKVRQSDRACFVFPCSQLVQELTRNFLKHYTHASYKRLENYYPLIVDEVLASTSEPFFLPWPKDDRLIKLLEMIVSQSAKSVDLEALAKKTGASKRTLLRLAHQELNMSLIQWRDQWRFVRAIELLQQKKSVLEVAFTLGYENSSGLVKLFKKICGRPPISFASSKQDQI